MIFSKSGVPNFFTFIPLCSDRRTQYITRYCETSPRRSVPRLGTPYSKMGGISKLPMFKLLRLLYFSHSSNGINLLRNTILDFFSFVLPDFPSIIYINGSK